METQLTTGSPPLPTTDPPPKPLKLKPKQKLTIKYWTDSTSNTFGNLYQSAILAGFRPSYALNLSHLRPLWLSDTLQAAQLEPQHIKRGIEAIAISAPNSKSEDDTRLKAYELLAKISGLTDTKNTVNVNIVQPILGGQSVLKPAHNQAIKQPKTKDNIIDINEQDISIDPQIHAVNTVTTQNKDKHVVELIPEED